MLTFAGNIAVGHADGNRVVMQHVVFADGESYCVDVEIAEDNQILFGVW